VEEIPISRAAKMTIQLLTDKGLFENYENSDKVLKDYLLVEIRKPDLDQ